MIRNMSVLHQNSGSIGKSIPDGQEIFAEPRKISRVDCEVVDFPMPPEFCWSTDIFASSILP